jgi:hypothetical protein
MTTSLDLSSVITQAVTPRGLKFCGDLSDPGWAFWELRTLNWHRPGRTHEGLSKVCGYT